MKKSFLTSLCALCTLFLIPSAVKAEVLLNEHFNQATSTLATNDNAFGNEIAATGWTNINGSGQIYMSSTNLSYSGYKSTVDETGGSAEYKVTFGKKVVTPLTKNVNSGSIYAAAIMDISGVGATGRDFNFAICTGTSSLATATNYFARIYIQQGTSSGFRIALAKGAEPNSLFLRWSEDLAFGKYLVVVEYQYISGDNNDVVNLYMNPVKGNKPSPSLTCVQDTIRPSDSQHYGASHVADASGLKSVMLYSSASNKAACLIDELKVVTDWADLWEAGEDPEPEPVIGVPEPQESDVTISSATISWDAVEDADSYILQWKVNGGSYSDDIEIDKDVRSYDMSGLESETKYYVRVKTIVGEDASEWAEINFTTEAEPATIDYKDITYNKYSTTDAMPTTGTYYLAKNVVEYDDVTLTGNLTLNLHGKQIFLYGTHIVVPSGITLTIYDDAETGNITGGYPGSFTDKGMITVQNGGTLIIGEGAIVNNSDDTDDYNVAIDVNNGGVVKVSGAPNISGVKHDIYLNGSAVITIESGKPLTNATPYKVYKLAGSAITSGWANMDGEKPSDFFTSSNSSARGICLNAGEAQIVPAINLSESSENTIIATYEDQLINVSMTRSILTSAHYNTICLPFALSAAQMEEIFGAGYDLEEFVSASLNEGILNLLFNQVDALVAGKPYLLKPAISVTNPSFEGVTIGATSPVDQTSDTYVSFHGTFAPTELTGGNKNILFLGANNELFWPTSTGNINGFRAYFELKGDAVANAVQARIGRAESQTTAIENQHSHIDNNKYMKDGQLLIERNGVIYNAQGQTIK